MISIIIPIYNAEKELERMLQSIQNQSVTEYEVIMIDDGSRDKTAEICKKFARHDARFQYYHQENKGVSIARNYGLWKSQGEYIAFVDADDEIDRNYLEILMQACRYADIAVCDVVVECNGIEIKRFTGEDAVLSKEEAINLLLKRKVINSGPCAKLFKREIIGTIEFPLLRTYEDILFNLFVFSNASNVAITSKTQYHYIENSQGAMSIMNKAPSKDVIVASERIIQFIKGKCDVLEQECLYITISHLFQYVLSMVHKECECDKSFIMRVKALYRKNFGDIWKCTAIPIKEKVVFICFMFGWVYTNKKWIYVNTTR